MSPACTRCGDTGKADAGNGNTKPCCCEAGLIERARRARLRRNLTNRKRSAARFRATLPPPPA